MPHALLRARDVWDACAALERRDLAIGARAGAQRIGAPRRGGRRGARGGVGRARTGWLRERPSRRGVGLSAARAPRRAALLRRRQPLFRAGAWRRAAAGVAGAGAARVHRPAARATVMNRATKTARHVRALAGLEARSPCAACPVCVSASPRSRSTVRESGSGPRYHGSDGVLPSGRDRREAGGGAEAAADAAAAQSCRAPEKWHTARRRRRRPPRWLSLLGRRRVASRRRQLLRRESSEATRAPPLCGSSL